MPTTPARYFSLLFIIPLTLISCSQTRDNPSVPVVDSQPSLSAFFTRTYQQDLQRSPMTQTYRGIKDNYHQWDNPSQAFVRESEALNAARLTELATFDIGRLDDSARLSARLYQQILLRNQAFEPFRHHSYIMQQFRGWHTVVPSFLINMHQIHSVADAEAYISRLSGVRELMDRVVEQLAIRQQQGIFPPRWSYPQMLEASRNVITGKPFDMSANDSALLADFRAKIATLALDNSTEQRLQNKAQEAMLNGVQAGYQRLIAELEQQMALASNDDGVWKLPNGDAYYAMLLNFYTTTDLNAEQIHQLGLHHVERIHTQMREIMKAVNFDGDLNAFFTFMREDSRFYYPNTDSGRQRYLDAATQAMSAMEEKLPTMFGLLPKAELTIKRVEAFREKSAGKAFYQSPAQDGSRPGIYYANLYNMDSMPSYQLEALAYHEGLPGHHMQRAITVELDALPDFQRYASFTAYTEGWGLYSEYLPKEMGFYQDPYSDFGRLAMELWRACRLVVDTGIHAKRWNREQAIEYLVNNTPNAKEDSRKAIERYIVYPGQATAYMIGKLKILELRQWARQQLGDQFDIRGFHDEVLKDGPVPLSLLETKIQRWVRQRKAA